MQDHEPPIRTLGVVGAGQMGSGIAVVAALSGLDVLLSDIDEEILDRAMDAAALAVDREIRHERVRTEAKAATLARIQCTTHVADHARCDFVIESAREDLAIKQKHAQLGTTDFLLHEKLVMAPCQAGKRGLQGVRGTDTDHVAALAAHRGDPDRDLLEGLGDVAAGPVGGHVERHRVATAAGQEVEQHRAEQLVLHEHHRIVIPNG